MREVDQRVDVGAQHLAGVHAGSRAVCAESPTGPRLLRTRFVKSRASARVMLHHPIGERAFATTPAASYR